MSMSRLISCVAIVTLCLVRAASSSAQQGLSPDAHRHAFAISGDVGGFPDAFSTRCGDKSIGGAGFGWGASAIDRPRHSVVIQGDFRTSWMPNIFGCSAVGHVDQIGPDVYETRPGWQAIPGTPSLPLIRTLIRVGLESPSDVAPIVRAMVGAGVIWAGHPAPLGSLSLAVASSNRGTRVFGEFEYDISRAREWETRDRFRVDSTGEIALGTFVVGRVEHPVWPTLRAGIEMSVP
jgi:hypothetical protein